MFADCGCSGRKRGGGREGVSRRCWGGDRGKVNALDWPAVEEETTEEIVALNGR